MTEIDCTTSTKLAFEISSSEIKARAFERRNNASANELLQCGDSSLQSWAVSNVWNPIVNTVAIDSHNAISSTVNDISKSLGGFTLLGDWKRAEVPAAEPLTTAWFAQNVSGGLAMIVPYGIATIATKGCLNRFARKIASEGASAQILNSRSTATILGATIYDGLKKPLDNETRFGNAMGAAVGFSVFETGNHFSRGHTGLKLMMTRALIGSAGATSHLTTSHIISEGGLPETNRVWNATLSGAVMNNALPALHDKLSKTLAPSEPARGAQKWRSLLESTTKDGGELDLLSVPPNEMPEFLLALSKSSEVNAKMLANRMATESLQTEVPAQIQALAQEMIAIGLKNPELVSNATLRSWLDYIPETDGSSFGGNRTAVVDSMPAHHLAEIIFPDKKLAQQISTTRPALVKKLAHEQIFTSNADIAASQHILSSWIQTQKLASLPDALSAALNADCDKVTFKLIEELAHTSTKSERQALIQDNINKALSASPEALSAHIEIAARAASGDKLLMSELSNQLSMNIDDASGLSYQRRMELNSELARLSRQEQIPAIDIPDARMKAVDIDPAVSTRIRAISEQSLLDGNFASLLNEGELTKILMETVGSTEKLQIRLAVDVRKNPLFETLSLKDQVNLLWASLLSNLSQKSERLSTGHEMSSANIAAGLLQTLNYAPERIQRINALISRQSDTMPGQSTSLRNPEHAMEVAIALRHPSAFKQLQIMNEAKANSNEHSVNSDLAGEQKLINMSVNRAAQKLPAAVPILTTPIKRGFRVESLSGDYVVMSHASPHLASFFRQLSTIETPEYAISATINTPRNRSTYKNASMVALVAGAPEQINAAARENLISGHRSNWQDHKQALIKPDLSTSTTTAELNLSLQRAASSEGAVQSLRDLSMKLAQFDNLAELQANGKADPLVSAHQSIIEMLTHSDDGNPLPATHEIKMINPKIVGLGIFRNGKNVSLENSAIHQTAPNFIKTETPSWLVAEHQNIGGVTVPEAVWRSAYKQGLPILSLD